MDDNGTTTVPVGGTTVELVDAEELAAEMFAETMRSEQSVRVVERDEVADDVRTRLRRLARQAQVRVRTARMADTVVAVRLDAAVWHESTAVMREKLT